MLLFSMNQPLSGNVLSANTLPGTSFHLCAVYSTSKSKVLRGTRDTPVNKTGVNPLPKKKRNHCGDRHQAS